MEALRKVQLDVSDRPMEGFPTLQGLGAILGRRKEIPEDARGRDRDRCVTPHLSLGTPKSELQDVAT